MAPDLLAHERFDWLELMADQAWEIEQSMRESCEEDWFGSPHQVQSVTAVSL